MEVFKPKRFRFAKLFAIFRNDLILTFWKHLTIFRAIQFGIEPIQGSNAEPQEVGIVSGFHLEESL